MTFNDAFEIAILHEAESWCPGCGDATTERFLEILRDLKVSDRPRFDRVMRSIVSEIHHCEGEKTAA